LLATNTESPLKLGEGASVWLALTECVLPEPAAVQFQTAGTGQLKLWLNGQPLDPAAATLRKGVNRLLVQVSGSSGPATFHVRFRRRGATAEHERLTQAALTRTGEAERGRQVILNVEKSQCLQCHR